MPPSLSDTFSVELVRPHGKQLSDVIDLWKTERRWLGMFPKGAFEDYARRGGIFAAVDPDENVLGYIAIRIASEWMHVAHLCVGRKSRGTSIARSLIEHAFGIGTDRQLQGIRLKCRDDYPAAKFWPQVGFRAMGISVGRGKDSAKLTLWVLRNNSLTDLFSRQQDVPELVKHVAILDANVFFDLAHESDDPDSLAVHVQESLFLAADFLGESVELAIVDEMFTEIHRRGQPEEVEKQRLRASYFNEIPYDKIEANTYVKALGKILGWEGTTKEQRLSDMRQIAKAAASRAEYFVTRDETLLMAAEPISNAMPIRVVSPAKLLSLLDEDARGHLYNPAKIQGTTIHESNPRQDFLDQHADHFLGRTPQEPGHSFRTHVRKLVASCAGSDENRIRLVQDEHGAPILLRSVSSVEKHRIQIPLLRSTPHHLGPTVTRHFILQEIQTAAKHSKHKIVISDDYLSNDTRIALMELGFIEDTGGWIKHLCPLVLSLKDTLNWPEWMPAAAPQESIHQYAADLESRYWPVKIAGADLPCASVTVRPHWAAKLFGGSCAEGELFPVDPAKVFNLENVFYRSVRGWPSTLPKRLLWYVSGTKLFRASSTLLKAETGTAKELFKRYERLGVYEWHDVRKAAGGDAHGRLMALHFAETEVFDHPVPLGDARKSGVGNIVIGVHPVSEDSFLQVYTTGLSRFRSS